MPTIKAANKSAEPDLPPYPPATEAGTDDGTETQAEQSSSNPTAQESKQNSTNIEAQKSAALQAHEEPPQPIDRAKLIKQRKIYETAYRALHKGQRKTYRRLMASLEGYPLAPYLRYYEIRRYISGLDTKSVKEFISANPDLAVIPHLNAAWAKQLAQRSSWKEYLEFYQPTGNTHLDCYHLWAQYQQGDETALAEVEPLWLVGKSQPSACDPLFQAWRASKYFNQEFTWQRFELAMNKGKLGLARYLSNSLSGEDATLAQEWIRLYRNPNRLANTKRYLGKSAKNQTVVLNGLIRLIRKDPEKAIELWVVYESILTFSDQQQQDFAQALATTLALRFHPAAAEWLAEANPYGRDAKLNDLAIRVALRNLDWNQVIILVQQLPDLDRTEEKVQYWYARAIKEHSVSKAQILEAESVLQNLAGQPNYYGFLAREIVQLPFQFTPIAKSVNDQELWQIENLPGIQRAREFFLLERPASARREWAAAIRKFSDRERIVASKLAEQWGWHDQAIRTVAKTSLSQHLDLRYPRAFQEPVNYFAKHNGLSNDWVYAIARQESLFTPDARSPVGALGMMQLMPNTAKAVAKQIGVNYRGKRDLLQPEKNIRLGTSYMRQLLSQFDENIVLATAAYNAGPHRVERWLPKEINLPADVWIETIPFKETRHYVKKVLTNRVIYKYQLGRTPELATSIRPIFSL